MTRQQAEELKRQVKARLRRGSTPAAELAKVGARPPKKRAPVKRKRRA
jgi:hypothetical protein